MIWVSTVVESSIAEEGKVSVGGTVVFSGEPSMSDDMMKLRLKEAERWEETR